MKGYEGVQKNVAVALAQYEPHIQLQIPISFTNKMKQLIEVAYYNGWADARNTPTNSEEEK